MTIGPAELLIILTILAELLVPIVLVVLGIRWLLGRSAARRAVAPSADPALALLRDRYARGEIDASEFEERKRTLRG